MSDLPILSQYSGESIDDLLRMEGRYRVDSLVLAVEQALGAKRERSGEQSLSDAEVIVLSVEALEREVNNGGYHQFFLNASNAFIGRIVSDLKRIGCEETAAITAQAIAALELEAFEPDAIQNRVTMDDDRLDEALDDLNTAYYTLAEDIAGKLLAFIKQNKDQFAIP